MTTATLDLTQALLTAVAATPGLAAASLVDVPGEPDSARLPAAMLLPLECALPSQDDLDRLTRVRLELALWRRDPDRQANRLALARLADAVTDSLLADPSQGGLALAGPGGAATEVSHAGSRKSSPPLANLVLHVDCWVLPAGGRAPLPADQQVLIDSQSLVASGPHALAVGEPERRRLDRQFSGLDGRVAIDLGDSPRTLTLTGRLVASNRSTLLTKMAAIVALNTSPLHTIAAPAGTFADVRIDRIRWGRLLNAGASRAACIGYEIAMTQMGA
ncbi:MAG: hypothetical protein PHU85_07540 [Phycisphaerae bacterium]|nr:hypothetical protein [Phycisphaerae bacterium]